MTDGYTSQLQQLRRPDWISLTQDEEGLSLLCHPKTFDEITESQTVEGDQVTTSHNKKPALR